MKGKILNILSILVGVAMIVFGANKFGQFIPMPTMTPEQLTVFGAFGVIKWLMPLVGITEMVGGIALAYPKTRTLGAMILFPIVIGILCHALTLDNSALGIAVVFFAIVAWVLFESKSKILALINE